MPLVKKTIPMKKPTPAPTVRASVIPATLRGLCVPIDSVKEWKDNPRKNDAAAQKLAELIRANGFRKPIVVDQNGIVRAGNTALKAMKILGELEIPIVKHDFKSEAAAVAFGISDNKASEWADWDDRLLSKLMVAEDVQQDSGFTRNEIAKLVDVSVIAEVNNSKKMKKLGEVIVLVMDSGKVEKVKEMLMAWVKVNGITGIKIQ